MSTTRSRSRPEPATDAAEAYGARNWSDAALILVGHGSIRCPHAVDTLARHAAALAARGLFAEVRLAVLKGGPTLADNLRVLRAKDVYIVPMFMGAGRSVSSKLLEALIADRRSTVGAPTAVHLCPPLGLHPMIADIATRQALAALNRANIDPATAMMILVGHGSSESPASREAAERQAARIRVRAMFRSVAACFLEEQPTFSRALLGVQRPAVVVGFFALHGRHASVDVAQAIAQAGSNNIIDLGPIGADEAIPDVVLEIIRLTGC